MEDILRETFETLKKIEMELNKIFRDIASKYPSISFPSGVYEPLVDIEETENEYIVYMDVPGFRKEDLKITVGDNYVEVYAERREEEKEESREKKYVVRQRFYETVKKRIELPSAIKPEEARASLNNGVLTIYLPKRVVSREVTIEL